MATKSGQARDVRIGLICALDVEYVIVLGLLDEAYGSIASKSYHFALGKIAGHQVAIGCLPREIGIAPVATLAMDMINTFKNMEFGLMVGIAGGAPSSKRDIRLGDVVVSRPDGNHNGVIGYQRGKAIQGGKYETAGQLNAPARKLLCAVQSVISNHAHKGQKLNETLQCILDKIPNLKDTYQRPAIETDILFQSSFVHLRPEEPCDDCREQGPIVQRPSRNDDGPAIHYGLIGSADTVMKDAIWRDSLIGEHNYLCFEMEAAGLMNIFPCLIIRGVSDYADSHKNNGWQQYAAGIAAAYAREILDVIPVKVVKEKATAPSSIQQAESTVSAKPPSHTFSGSFSSNRNMINGSVVDTKGNVTF